MLNKFIIIGILLMIGLDDLVVRRQFKAYKSNIVDTRQIYDNGFIDCVSLIHANLDVGNILVVKTNSKIGKQFKKLKLLEVSR